MSLITSIQKYAIHDGDGIRTTVFFKGCKLRCAWCHNPETQRFEAETFCDGEIVGKEYTAEQLVRELKKDEMFYEVSGGGVTLSGGEVMNADMDYVEAVCKKLVRQGISINIDTCGQAPYASFERLFPYVDTFLYDIKHMNSQVHRKYTGVGNELILANLEKLSSAGAKIVIRIPVIKEINGDKDSMQDIIQYLLDKNVQVKRIHLLPYHNTGSGKYEKLGRSYKGAGFHAASQEEMESFVQLFQAAGFQKIKIGG